MAGYCVDLNVLASISAALPMIGIASAELGSAVQNETQKSLVKTETARDRLEKRAVAAENEVEALRAKIESVQKMLDELERSRSRNEDDEDTASEYSAEIQRCRVLLERLRTLASEKAEEAERCRQKMRALNEAYSRVANECSRVTEAQARHAEAVERSAVHLKKLEACVRDYLATDPVHL